MLSLKNKMNDLINCFNLPILILDKDFKNIYSNKHPLKLEYNSNLVELIEKLRSRKFVPSITIHKSNKDFFYCVVMFSIDNQNMHLLIGPYLTEISSTHKDLLIINETYLKRVVRLYIHILDKKHVSCSTKNYNSPSIERAIEYIHSNYSSDISIDDLCKTLNINKCYFCSMFKKETGLTFTNYLNNYRIEKSKELLENPNLSLLDISMLVGFNNQSYYSTVFKKHENITPLEFRENIL